MLLTSSQQGRNKFGDFPETFVKENHGELMKWILALSKRMRCSAAVVDSVYREIPVAIPVDVTRQWMRPALDMCYSSAGTANNEDNAHAV